jgi:hypothetical protein
MSQSKTVEMLIQRKLLLMQELAEIDRALKAIEPRDTLQASDFFNEQFREEETRKMRKEAIQEAIAEKEAEALNKMDLQSLGDLDDNPLHHIGYGRGDD